MNNPLGNFAVLPLEVRTMIWSHLQVRQDKRGLAFLSTSRALNSEAGPVIYRHVILRAFRGKDPSFRPVFVLQHKDGTALRKFDRMVATGILLNSSEHVRERLATQKDYSILYNIPLRFLHHLHINVILPEIKEMMCTTRTAIRRACQVLVFMLSEQTPDPVPAVVMDVRHHPSEFRHDTNNDLGESSYLPDQMRKQVGDGKICEGQNALDMVIGAIWDLLYFGPVHLHADPDDLAQLHRRIPTDDSQIDQQGVLKLAQLTCLKHGYWTMAAFGWMVLLEYDFEMLDMAGAMPSSVAGSRFRKWARRHRILRYTHWAPAETESLMLKAIPMFAEPGRSRHMTALKRRWAALCILSFKCNGLFLDSRNIDPKRSATLNLTTRKFATQEDMQVLRMFDDGTFFNEEGSLKEILVRNGRLAWKDPTIPVLSDILKVNQGVPHQFHTPRSWALQLRGNDFMDLEAVECDTVEL